MTVEYCKVCRLLVRTHSTEFWQFYRRAVYRGFQEADACTTFYWPA